MFRLGLVKFEVLLKLTGRGASSRGAQSGSGAGGGGPGLEHLQGLRA